MPERLTFFERVEIIEVRGDFVYIKGASGQFVANGVMPRAEARRLFETGIRELNRFERESAPNVVRLRTGEH